jgi:hypothetical protein
LNVDLRFDPVRRSGVGNIEALIVGREKELELHRNRDVKPLRSRTPALTKNPAGAEESNCTMVAPIPGRVAVS